MLVPNANTIFLPQNSISNQLENKIENEIYRKLKQIVKKPSIPQTMMLADKLFLLAMNIRLRDSDNFAANTEVTDEEKIDQITNMAIALAIELNNEGKLESLLDS